MNAKVQIQLLEQLIPFYSTVDMLDAYSLAFETTSQLQTLINQIRKSTVQIKIYAEESNIHSDVFSELESLISISQHLSENHNNTFDVEREKYQSEFDLSNTQYDAGDLFNAYSLAHEATLWLQTMFYQIKHEAEAIKQKTIKLGSGIFTNLERLIHIAEYLADSYSDTLNTEREKYEVEWEVIKNG